MRPRMRTRRVPAAALLVVCVLALAVTVFPTSAVSGSVDFEILKVVNGTPPPGTEFVVTLSCDGAPQPDPVTLTVVTPHSPSSVTVTNAFEQAPTPIVAPPSPAERSASVPEDAAGDERPAAITQRLLERSVVWSTVRAVWRRSEPRRKRMCPMCSRCGNTRPQSPPRPTTSRGSRHSSVTTRTPCSLRSTTISSSVPSSRPGMVGERRCTDWRSFHPSAVEASDASSWPRASAGSGRREPVAFT